ncbi:TetR/AcrR family transcriptional regulator [Streptomyces telluris]|uniref:TetR/AcrR family transcriptional regulator C-terminal domain-containing protein n=1 Tax=Streptomyces telluris TaxID=2720021 RepID=A0A9X2LGC4_9ACTN|nr:TetR/AcrR family transcriptional regulator C-terminal domain-containing protein [Streptomyces telluris]MCQ8770886.1 TetR/AcrR family transcriptional regulator C-terminal domain-containing protein [Streptomyces telluris]NJP79591.1 TetR/AcrR family transcriptional regulator [Streptomyces telluris]
MAGGGKGAASGPRASVWLAGKPDPAPRRGDDQGAGLDRRRIVATTIRLLDAEGLEKFSMRRLAAELGVTAMSVYWYVDNKDDLLEYALDEIWAEVPLPDPSDEGADWRDQLRSMAEAYRRCLADHPWVSHLVGRYLNLGPHSMAFSNSTLVVMARSGIPQERVTGALAALFQFVYGFCTVEGLYKERCRAAGVTEDEYFRDVMNVVTAKPEWAETYQEAAEVTETWEKAGSVAEMRQRDFAYALDTVIAGIEVMRDRGPDA